MKVRVPIFLAVRLRKVLSQNVCHLGSGVGKTDEKT